MHHVEGLTKSWKIKDGYISCRECHRVLLAEFLPDLLTCEDCVQYLEEVQEMDSRMQAARKLGGRCRVGIKDRIVYPLHIHNKRSIKAMWCKDSVDQIFRVCHVNTRVYYVAVITRGDPWSFKLYKGKSFEGEAKSKLNGDTLEFGYVYYGYGYKAAKKFKAKIVEDLTSRSLRVRNHKVMYEWESKCYHRRS